MALLACRYVLRLSAPPAVPASLPRLVAAHLPVVSLRSGAPRSPSCALPSLLRDTASHGRAFSAQATPAARPTGPSTRGSPVPAAAVGDVAPAAVGYSSQDGGLAEHIRVYSRKRIRPVTLKQFTDHAKGLIAGDSAADAALISTRYLITELPVRLAHAIKELETLPSLLRSNENTRQVLQWYKLSFKEMVEMESVFHDAACADREHLERSLQDFCEKIDVVHRRHASVVMTLALGVEEYKRQLRIVPPSIDKQLDHFLDRFFMSRIGLRTLISQHLALHTENSSRTGTIDEDCDVREVILDAAQHATQLVRDFYGQCTTVDVVGSFACFPYIPSHLYLMMFEVLKNALRAVVEYHAGIAEEELPRVEVRIARGDEDLTLRISDEGGGVPRSEISKLFTYTYSTARSPCKGREAAADTTDMLHAPVAGLGYGLPISRLYARYLGGDLQVLSMEGHGTDVFIYLNHRSHWSEEVLPSFEGVGAPSSYAIRDLHPWQRS